MLMKVFASDYDGTIKVDGIVSEENLAALAAWKDKGNRFGIVTGRSVESTLLEVNKYGYALDFMICNNGGVIYDGNQTLLKSFAIDFNKALALIEEIRKMDCNCFVLNNGVQRAKEVVNSEYEDYKYGAYSSDYSVERIIAEGCISQIVISLNDDALGLEIAAYINEAYKGYVEAYPNVNCVDIVAANVSKASGIAYIAKHYDYAHDAIYTMGDSYNDISMLEAYQSATLEHANDAIKAVANEVCADVAQFLNALEK